jgi:hypothetical protein
VPGGTRRTDAAGPRPPSRRTGHPPRGRPRAAARPPGRARSQTLGRAVGDGDARLGLQPRLAALESTDRARRFRVDGASRRTPLTLAPWTAMKEGLLVTRSRCLSRRRDSAARALYDRGTLSLGANSSSADTTRLRHAGRRSPLAATCVSLPRRTQECGAHGDGLSGGRLVCRPRRPGRTGV